VSDFDFFRQKRIGYVPRTPGTALRALGNESARAGDFVWRSTSAKPLDEQPFDLEAIERTLANADLELETAKLLMGIFEKMIKGRDQEIALFGAEGINTLEGRYIARVESLKWGLSELEGTRQTGASDTPGYRKTRARTLRDLARAYYELAELHAKVKAIRTFYLREAHAVLHRSLGKGARFPQSVVALSVDILVGLGLYAQAARWLKRIKPADNPFIIYQTARIAFHRRDYATVVGSCGRLEARAGELHREEERAARFWAGL